MRKSRKLLALLLMGATVVGVSACGNDKHSSKNNNGAANASYTLNDYIGASPKTWNNHIWETNADSYIMGYTEIGFYDIATKVDADGNPEAGYVFVDELAVGDPVDITATAAQSADFDKYGIPEGAESGYAFQINLNPNAKWANGDEINADDYVYSMKALLDPKMKNYRANSYYQNDGEIANAKTYYDSQSKIYERLWVDIYEGDELVGEEKNPNYDGSQQLYFSLTEPAHWGYSWSDIYNDFEYDFLFVNEEGVDLYKKYSTEKGYFRVTEEVKADIAYICEVWATQLFDIEYEDHMWEYSVVYDTGRVTDAYDFENVGLFKSGEHQITMVLANQVSMWNLKILLGSTWLVYEDLYEKGKTTVGDLVTTNYATSVDTYMSYGPYMLTAYEDDKQITMEKNPNWYGYSDGNHVGQYQTTRISTKVISDHNTAMMSFLSGSLDSISLEAADMNEYRYSDYLLKTDESYTMRFVFNTDKTALAKFQEEAGAGYNKMLLAYEDFRKGFSLAINRNEFTRTVTAGYKSAYSLLNSLYYYDMENNIDSIYRNTDEAKQILVDLYGLEYGEGKLYENLDEAHDAITGYDVAAAREHFQAAYDKAVEAGDYNGTDKVEFTVLAASSTISDELAAQEKFVNDALAEATKGTGLEGKVKLKYATHEDRYTAMSKGEAEIMWGAWGGAYLYPFNMMSAYVGTEEFQAGKVNEYGFNPTVQTMDVTYDFDGDGTPETLTKTYAEWQAALVAGGEYFLADGDLKLYVLAALEYNLLDLAHMVPICSTTSVSMYSKKINYITTEYNVLAGYGGIRYLTYNYSDAEWNAYVASQNGQLDYE